MTVAHLIPFEIVGIQSGLMIQCQNLTGGSQMKKILTKIGITFPPVKIVGIHSGLMIHCQNLTGGSQMKKILTKIGITFPPAKIVGIHSGLMIQCQNLAGGSQMKKNIDQKREPPLFWSIYFPPHHYFAQGPYTLKRFSRSQ